MSRTPAQRYNETLQYLEKISAELAGDVKKQLSSRIDEAGKDISLEGLGYWRSGSDAQHAAVRALVLCQKAFLTPPYFKGFYIGFKGEDTKRFYHGKPEQMIKDAILCYTRKPASLPALVEQAKLVNETSGDFDFYKLTRQSRNLGASPICFAAVRMWLFKAGFVSVRWLASTGFDLTAYTANTILGDGKVVQFNQLDQIPAGHIFNFHSQASKPTCHWGLSLGGGIALAANTQEQILGSPAVKFIEGNSVYGKFKMADSYVVSKWKYALYSEVEAFKKNGTPLPEVVIRDIDPSIVPSYF